MIDLSRLARAPQETWGPVTERHARLCGAPSPRALVRALRAVCGCGGATLASLGLELEARRAPGEGGRAAFEWRWGPATRVPAVAQLQLVGPAPVARETLPPIPVAPPVPRPPPGRPPLPPPPPPSPAARLADMVRAELDLLSPGLGQAVQVQVRVSVGPLVVEGDGRSARAVAREVFARLAGAGAGVAA